MKILKSALCCIFTITAFLSCNQKQDALIGTWEFVNISDYNSFEEYDYQNFKSFITFSSDSSFLFVDRGVSDPIKVSDIMEGNYENEKSENGRVYCGTWTTKDSFIIFNIKNYKTKQKFISKIFLNDGKNLSLRFSTQKRPTQNNTAGMFKYRKIDYDDAGKTKNNFTSQQLNKWRIKYNKKSSRAEIKSKVENALEYAINFLEFYQSGSDKSAITYFLQPLPFQFYANGMVLKSQDKNEDWNRLFYDNEDADIGYSILKAGFNSVAEIPENLSRKPLKINLFILEETLKNIKQEN